MAALSGVSRLVIDDIQCNESPEAAAAILNRHWQPPALNLNPGFCVPLAGYG